MLLEWAEIDFEVIVKHTDEQVPEGMPVAEVPVAIARQKALAVQQSLLKDSEGLEATSFHLPILAADTVVALGKQIIGKPKNREDAISILQQLSGQLHQVITGVVLLTPTGEHSFADTTSVQFYQLSQQQIEYYVDKYQPYDKAGAYAIQEWIGVVGIQRIDGDFYNVMGLPVSRVVQAIQRL
jgi:septum formation protein